MKKTTAFNNAVTMSTYIAQNHPQFIFIANGAEGAGIYDRTTATKVPDTSTPVMHLTPVILDDHLAPLKNTVRELGEKATHYQNEQDVAEAQLKAQMDKDTLTDGFIDIAAQVVHFSQLKNATREVADIVLQRMGGM
jgi:hypothetical protein